jgi:hypothetical protein
MTGQLDGTMMRLVVSVGWFVVMAMGLPAQETTTTSSSGTPTTSPTGIETDPIYAGGPEGDGSTGPISSTTK